MQFRIQILVICLLLSFTQGFTLRTRCSSNRLSFTKKFAQYYLTAYKYPSEPQVTNTLTEFLYAVQSKLFHYGRPIKSQNQSVCKKYFLPTQESCCTEQDILNFTSINLQLYNLIYLQKVKYPSFMYLDQISAELGVLCPSEKDTLGNDLKQLNLKHQQLLQLIFKFQIDYIKSSVCLLCISPKDFHRFLHPLQKDVLQNNFYQLIYNQDYLRQSVQQLAGILIEFGKLHDQLIQQLGSFITKVGLQKCSLTKAKMRNQTKWSPLKVCSGNNPNSCRKFVVQAIGGVATPEIIRMFGAIFRGGVPIMQPISISKLSGFSNIELPQNTALYDSKLYSTSQSLISDMFG